MADAPENFPVGAVAKGRTSEVRCALAVVHNARVVDVRTYAAFTDDGELRPTRRGVCVSVGQLRALRDTLTNAVHMAEGMGWLEAAE